MTRAQLHVTGVIVLLIGLLPVFAINLAYIIAVAVERVPACIPYLDGCTSISSTGRHPPSSYVFKPALYLSAVLMIAFWSRSSPWLRGMGEQSDWPGRRTVLAGFTGAIALCVYVYYMGSEGSAYRLMRRYGVTVYFGFTYLALLLLAGRLYNLALRGSNASLLRIVRLQLILCMTLLVVGLVSIPVTNYVANKGEIQNVIEWNFALLLHACFLPVWAALRRSDPV